VRSGPLNAEGQWTFPATGLYVRAMLALHEATGDGAFVDRAREPADLDLALLARRPADQWPQW
jgi:hypothetical protein